MAASPIAAAVAAALALAPPALQRHVPTDRFIVTDTWAVAVAQPEGPPVEAPGGPATDAPAEVEVREVATAPVPAASPTPEGPAPAPAVDLGCHGSGPCQRLIALGSVAGGLGLAALAAGAALLVRPVSVAPDDPTTVVTYRPAGAALLAIGTGLAATWLLTLLAARKASRLAQRRHASQTAP
jgi:hypothetical protein